MAEVEPEIQLWSSAPAARPLPREAWPLPLRHEVAVLAAANGVRSDSISVYEYGNSPGAQRLVITCAVERGDPSKMEDIRISPVEPLALVYPASKVGSVAPQIYSERIDFPKDLPHLNPVSASCPASPCIAREGTQALYDRGGITMVIDELVSWLTDAAAGTLERDGWEPMPVSGAFELSTDIAWLQESAYQHGRRTACLLHGIGHLVFAEREGRLARLYADLQTPSIALDKLLHHKPKHKILSNGGESETRADVPWFLIAGPSNQPVSERLAREIDNEGALQDAAVRARCDVELTRILEEILPRLQESRYIHVCLLVGTWRPASLISDIPGLAQGVARHCELSACCIGLTKQDGRPAIDRVYPLRIVAAPSRSLMAQTSALGSEPVPCALIGCGALGAKLGEFLVREGIAQLSLVDPDVLAPHNLARHTLGRASLGLPKVKELKRHLERIASREQDFSCRARTMRIDELDDKALSKALGSQPHWVIDATADIRAARRLTLSGQPRPVIRVELADGGRLGLLAVEGVKRNPRLDDLQATLYQTALNRPEIAAWLQRDAGLAPVMVGVGCASATMQMPDSRVALHAAAFMPSINARIVGKEVCGGGLGINHLDSYGQPLGWAWVDVPPFESIRVEVSDPALEPWELRVHPGALEVIETVARAKRPMEAGGYLYGRFDVGARTLTVVEAVALQSHEATATKLVLPPAGRSPREREIIERCGTSLRCLGPWHSHPIGDASWSARDRSQAEEFARANRVTPQPTVMLIVSAVGRAAYLILPENM